MAERERVGSNVFPPEDPKGPSLPARLAGGAFAGVSAVTIVGASFFALRFAYHEVFNIPYAEFSLPNVDVAAQPPTPEPPAVVPEVTATPAPGPVATEAPVQPPPQSTGSSDGLPVPQGPDGSEVEEEQAPQGPDGSDTEEPKAPEATFASKDQYEQAKLNLGGVDTDGDGIKDGVANPVSINDPTPTDVYNFKDSISIPLTDGQAKMALVDGGFVKDGVTYEIWESKSNPGQYEIVAVDKDHPLAGNVINVDTAILTPDVEEPSPTEAPADTQVTSDESPNETYPTDVREDLEYSFGLIDPETGEQVPGTGQAGLAQAIYDVGFFRPEDYLGENPFTEGTLKHHQWQRIHDFMVRHLN